MRRKLTNWAKTRRKMRNRTTVHWHVFEKKEGEECSLERVCTPRCRPPSRNKKKGEESCVVGFSLSFLQYCFANEFLGNVRKTAACDHETKKSMEWLRSIARKGFSNWTKKWFCLSSHHCPNEIVFVGVFSFQWNVLLFSYGFSGYFQIGKTKTLI